MAELKPCPFCGGEAMLISFGDFTGNYFDVSCKSIGCYAFRWTDDARYTNKDAAIEAWNRRANDGQHS